MYTDTHSLTHKSLSFPQEEERVKKQLQCLREDLARRKEMAQEDATDQNCSMPPEMKVEKG